MSTNAAFKPSSRLRTLPLKMLPTKRSSVVRSMLNSSSFPSSRMATRVSSVSALMMTSLCVFLWFDKPLDFFDERRRGIFYRIQNALGLLLDFHGLKFFFFLHLRGNF